MKQIIPQLDFCILFFYNCIDYINGTNKPVDKVINPVDSLVNYRTSLSVTDELGRKLPTHDEVGDSRRDKFVDLFSWTWYTNFTILEI